MSYPPTSLVGAVEVPLPDLFTDSLSLSTPFFPKFTVRLSTLPDPSDRFTVIGASEVIFGVFSPSRAIFFTGKKKAVWGNSIGVNFWGWGVRQKLEEGLILLIVFKIGILYLFD